MTSPHADLLSELPFIVGSSSLAWPAAELQVLAGSPERLLGGEPGPISLCGLIHAQDRELYAGAVAERLTAGGTVTVDFRLRDGKTWLREWTKAIGAQRLSVIMPAPSSTVDAATAGQIGALAHDLRNVAFLLSTSACSLGPRSSAQDVEAAAQDAQHAARSCTNAGRLLQSLYGASGDSRAVEVAALFRSKLSVARRLCDGQKVEFEFALEPLHASVDIEALANLLLMVVARRSAQLGEEGEVHVRVTAQGEQLVIAVAAHSEQPRDVLSDRALQELTAKLGGELHLSGATLEVRLPILRDAPHP